MSDICYPTDPAVKYYNKLVHALTNQKVNFTNDFFPDGPEGFEISEQTSKWNRVQAALGLDYRGHNQYLFMALQTLHSRPPMLDLLTDNDPTYDIRTFPKELTTFEDAQFLLGPSHGNILGPKTFPISNEFAVSYLDATSVRVDDSNQGFRHLRYTQMELSNPDSIIPFTRLNIVWGDLPIEGVVQINGPWSAGKNFDINYVPPRVDPDLWISHVESVVDPLTFLAPVGLFEEYRHSFGSSERLAVYLIALALQNTSLTSWPQT
jgi:hypothetical protein